MMTTFPAATRLEVAHDGIRANATVIHNGRACSLDSILEAAKQQDAELSAGYADILRAIAPELYVVIEKEIDGHRDNRTCWYAVRLTHGINGDTLTTYRHRLTRRDFRSWGPEDHEIRAEETAILRTAVRIGLGQAQHWRGGPNTVAGVLAAR